jgi:hypothetical protein
MNTHDAIGATLGMSSLVISRYLEDLSDADLMNRPGPGCNHIAWQLGHLIVSENRLLEAIAPGASIELPAGFAEKYSKDQAGNDNAADFCTKQEYRDLFDQVHAATLAAVSKLSDADLDQPAPENLRKRFPTVGNIVILIAVHGLMHAGQFVPVRRKLSKPVVI